MAASLFEILKIRGLLPFSGVMLTVLLTVSMSVHFRAKASPHLAPVSLSAWRNTAIWRARLLLNSDKNRF